MNKGKILSIIGLLLIIVGVGLTLYNTLILKNEFSFTNNNGLIVFLMGLMVSTLSRKFKS